MSKARRPPACNGNLRLVKLSGSPDGTVYGFRIVELRRNRRAEAIMQLVSTTAGRADSRRVWRCHG